MKVSVLGGRIWISFIHSDDMLTKVLQMATTQPQWTRAVTNDSYPRQNDVINCGIYVLRAISMLLRENDPLLVFSAKRPNCTRWRQQLMWSLFTGTVHLDLITGANQGDLPWPHQQDHSDIKIQLRNTATSLQERMAQTMGVEPDRKDMRIKKENTTVYPIRTTYNSIKFFHLIPSC